MTDDRWDVARVRGLAPDQRSFAAAQRLARSGVWSDLGHLDALLWGRCQGSGATPYQVTVDTSGPAVQCSCPSRKQPCKHGLALLLRWVTQGEGFTATQPSGDAARFAASRPGGEGDAGARTPADPVAQARRLQRRIALMDGGMAELDRWLTDLMVDGLAAARGRPHSWWDQTAARLVDAQMPGLADRVRGVGQQIAADEDWASTLLQEVARWHLAVVAWRRRDDLPADDAADLRTFLGWSRTADEVLAGRRVDGDWTVLGVATSQSGRLTQQRTWLTHPTEGLVVLLDFAAGGAAPAVTRLVGAVLRGTAAVYPGAPPRRIRFTDDPADAGRVEGLPDAVGGWSDALAQVGAAMAAAPWQDRFGVAVDGLRLTDVDDDPLLVDGHGLALPVVGIDGVATLALTGGRAVTVFTEVVGGRCRPLSLVAGDQLVSVPAEPEPEWRWDGG